MNAVLESSSKSSAPALTAILLGYMREIDAHYWPGMDGLTLDVVLDGYLRAAADGHVPGKADLLRGHPDLSVEIETFFRASRSVANASGNEIWQLPDGEFRAD